MSNLLVLKFRIIQDPIDHPTIDRGTHTVRGSTVDECWDIIQDRAQQICNDEYTISLICEVSDE
jgi:hypothetical protein